MATVVMPQLTNHLAIASRSSVNVENTRTGFSSRSGGTATKISRAPISIPAALGSRSGRSSRHIPLRLRPRLPLPASVFFSPDFGGCLFCLDILPDPFYSGNGQVAQMEVLFSPESAWGAASDCNHCMAHGTWDHASDRV